MMHLPRLVLLGVLSTVFTGAAQAYPTKPLRLVVGFSPGGSTDVTARILAERMSVTLGQQVIVDNRAGAGGNIGADLVAKSNPDGYTILMATTGVMAFNHYLYTKLPDMPTIAEAGVPGYEATSWNGFAVPAGTPKAVIRRLQQETQKAVEIPEVKEKLFGLGIEAIAGTPEQFAALIKSEREKWVPLLKKIGVEPQ